MIAVRRRVPILALIVTLVGAPWNTLMGTSGEGAEEKRPRATGYPPVIEVTKPPDESTRHSQNTEIRLDYRRDYDCMEPVMPGEPDPCEPVEDSLKVWVNDVDETSKFTKHGGWANSTSVTLPDNSWSTIIGKICNDFGCGWDTVQVYIETKPAPEVSLLPTDDQVLDRGLCASFPSGPAATWACDEFLITHSTIPYYSLGKARGVSLVYSSQLAYPHVLIRADVAFAWESIVPDTLAVKLKLNDTDHGKEIFYSTSGVSTADSADTRRIVLPLNAEGLAPGRHDIDFVATSWWGGQGKTGSDEIGFAFDSVVAAKISRGWAVAGLARVIQDGDNLVWSDGAGTTHYYLEKNATSYYLIEGVLAQMAIVQPPDSSANKTWKRTLPDGSLEYYNSSGQLKYVIGVNPSDTTTFHYNGASIDSITDATGQTIAFTYSSGRLSAIKYPSADTTGAVKDSTWLEYDSGRLKKIYDPDGRYVEFSYDGSTHRITARKDRSGASTTYTWYNYTPRVRRVDLPVGSDSLLYAAAQLKGLADTTVSGLSLSDPAPTPPKVSEVKGSITNPRSYADTFKVNEFGGLLEWKDALNRVTTYERDANSLVTSRIGPDSVEFFWRRISELGLLRATNDIGTDSTMALLYPTDQWGTHCPAKTYPCLPLKQIRSRGYGNPKDTTSYTYTGNRLSQVTHPGGGTTSYEYSGVLSQLDTITDPAGHKKVFEYDSSTGHLIRAFKEWGSGSQGDSVRYWYDGKGRKTQQTVDMPDANFKYGKVYTEYEYDQLNRITKVHRIEMQLGDPDPEEKYRHTVTYAYDDTAKTLTVTDPKSQSQKFTYDALGRLARRDDPAGNHETFNHDANGNLTSWTTRRDTTITYSYDALDRLVSKSVPGVGTTTYGYHALRGTLDTIITPNTKNYREFDARGRILLDSSWVAGVSGEGRAVRYTYDAQGNLSTIVDPWGDTLTYDPTPEPKPYGSGFKYLAKTWENSFDETTNWYYDADGLPIKIGYANSQRDTIVHDERHRTTRLGDVSYTRNARAGRIDSMTVSSPTDDRVVRYTYDFKGQLTQERDSVAGETPVVRSFSYDAAGNRTGTGYKYDPDDPNRLRATPTDTFTYDNSGNLTWWKEKSSGDYKTFSWDAENRLTQVKLYTSGGGSPYRTVTFVYDGLGHRVKKVVTGDQTDTVRYVYDGSELLATLDGSGNWTRRYTPHPTGVDRMISVRTSADSSYYLHHDFQGNVVRVTNASGTAVSKYRYEGFGNHTAIGTEGYASPMLWQGREYDSETGLYYFRARYYAPDLGRFFSEDPLGGHRGANLYIFGRNDPISFADPSGLYGCEIKNGRFQCTFGGVTFACPGARNLLECSAQIADAILRWAEEHMAEALADLASELVPNQARMTYGIGVGPLGAVGSVGFDFDTFEFFGQGRVGGGTFKGSLFTLTVGWGGDVEPGISPGFAVGAGDGFGFLYMSDYFGLGLVAGYGGAISGVASCEIQPLLRREQ